MSFVNETFAGSFSPSLSTATCNNVSYMVMMLSMGGANFGGPQITQAATALKILPLALNVTVAVIGPSDTSSYQPSRLAKSFPGASKGAWIGEPELPNPPRTRRRPSRSVRISPNGTIDPRNVPVSKLTILFGPLKERCPGSIKGLLRSLTEAFRSGLFGFKPTNRFHEAFLFARCAVQQMLASLDVISFT